MTGSDSPNRASPAFLKGLWLVSVLMGITAAGCGNQPPTSRAVSIATTACGHASLTNGVGVVVADGLVLVAAHVVIGATDITVSVDGESGDDEADETLPATIVRLDPRTDLALLAVDGVTAEAVELGFADVGDTVTIIEGRSAAASVQVDVVRVVEIRIEEVRSTKRSSRSGYEIDHRVDLGDSGAGVFDDDGRLVGVVFGRIQGDGDRSFVVDANEIDEILYSQPDSSFVCDATQNKVVER